MKRFVLPILCLAGGVVATIALASPQATQDTLDSRSRFSVVTAGETSIKVETSTGKTWILKQSADPSSIPVWVPIENIDHNHFVKWNAKEELRARLVKQRTRALQMQDTGTSRLYQAEYEAVQAKVAEIEAEIAAID